MKKINWLIRQAKLSELLLNDSNPRTISGEGYDQLGKDLELGHFKVIVVDTNMIILGGNQRYRKLCELYNEDYLVNISYPDRELTESERKKIIILDNKQRGLDDMDMLLNEYEDEMKELGLLEQIERPENLERNTKDNKIQLLITLQDRADYENFKEKLDELLLEFPDVDYSVKAGEV